MVGTRLESELEQRLRAVAAKTGRSASHYVRQAIRDRIEDWEDEAIAVTALRKPGRRWSLDQLERGIDLKADGLDG